MFEGLTYITVYYLSGLSANRFEIWSAHRKTIVSAPDSLTFSAYLSWPIEEVITTEDCHIRIENREGGLVFRVDWFPEEPFALKPFVSPHEKSIILKGSLEREIVFIHLES